MDTLEKGHINLKEEHAQFKKLYFEQSVDITVIKQKNEDIAEDGPRKQISLDCKDCHLRFTKACQFERHLEDQGIKKGQSCDVCGMQFHLKRTFILRITKSIFVIISTTARRVHFPTLAVSSDTRNLSNAKF